MRVGVNLGPFFSICVCVGVHVCVKKERDRVRCFKSAHLCVLMEVRAWDYVCFYMHQHLNPGGWAVKSSKRRTGRCSKWLAVLEGEKQDKPE